MLSPEQLAEWGRSELDARKADLAKVHANEISLEEAQNRAKARRKAVGLRMSQATRALPNRKNR